MAKHGNLLFLLPLILIAPYTTTVPGAYAQASYALAYNLNYTTPAYPGGSTTLINVFTNNGGVLERVTAVRLTFDLGVFTGSSGLPLVVPVGQAKQLNMTVQLPSSASVGSHSGTASIDFQYQDPGTLQWVTPSTSPLVITGGIQLTANPGGLAAAGFIIFGVIAALAFAVVYLVIRMRRKPKAGPMIPPPPSPVPPSSQP